MSKWWQNFNFWVDYPFNPQDIICGVLECDSLFQTCGEIIKIYNYGEKFVREAVKTAVSANQGYSMWTQHSCDQC